MGGAVDLGMAAPNVAGCRLESRDRGARGPPALLSTPRTSSPCGSTSDRPQLAPPLLPASGRCPQAAREETFVHPAAKLLAQLRRGPATDRVMSLSVNVWRRERAAASERLGRDVCSPGTSLCARDAPDRQSGRPITSNTNRILLAGLSTTSTSRPSCLTCAASSVRQVVSHKSCAVLKVPIFPLAVRARERDDSCRQVGAVAVAAVEV